MLFSLVFSVYVISLAMIGLLATALFDVKFDPSFRIGINPMIFSHGRNFFRSPIFWVLAMIFFIAFIGIINSEDFSYWLDRVRIKLPFFLLPFAFYFLPHFDRRDIHFIFYFLLAFMSLTCIGVLVNYGLNFEEFNELVAQGKHIPVPRNHVRFSLLLAIAVLFGINMYSEKYVFRKSWERSLILSMTIICFISLHILSVKSGLMILYVGLLIGLIRYVIMHKKFAQGLIGLLGLLSIPMLSYLFIPSLQTKMNYFRWDVISYLEGNFDQQRSDSGRLRSLKIGAEIFQENMIFGIGTGDLKNEVYARYKSEYPNAFKKVMPHNQFLSVAAANGLVGLLVFLFALFYPLLFNKAYKDYYLLISTVSIVLSFMVENTIGNSTGVAIHCFLILLLLNHLHHPMKEESNKRLT